MAGQQVEYVLIGENTLEVAFVMEVSREMNDHNKLYNKSLPNQHPISSITDLTETLAGIDTKEGNLENLTTDNKENLVGAINEVDSHTDTNATNLSNHISDKNNPHEVTKAQVGLGNVDNTSDLNKPISTATQSALDLKVNTADLGNAELDIQKNGVSVGKFTANASTDKVINIVVPTKASDVNALPDTTKYGASLVMSINSSTFVVTAQLKDQDGNNLGSAQTIDLPLESVVVNGSYDSDNKKIILTLENGNTIDIPVGDLVAGLQDEITTTNKLDSDLVDDNGQTNKFVTASEKSQITTNANNITDLQTNKADKSTTYTKTEVDTIATGKANVGLDNLNADGQMVIDSQNGTISNCILEIPQNLKIEISGTTITLKNGCVIPMTGSSTYTTVTLSADSTRDMSGFGNGTYYLIYSGSQITLYDKNRLQSGSSLPENPAVNDRFYLTTDYSCYYGNNNNEWEKNAGSYPLGILIRDSEGFHFAKDSNGNDMIFNGTGFIGHHAFVYPNVRGLISQEKDTNGSLKSINQKLRGLYIAELNTTNNVLMITSYSAHLSHVRYGGEVDNMEELPNLLPYYYVKNRNRMIKGSNKNDYNGVILADCTYDDTTVTDFTIRQPYEGARNLLTDDIEEEVATKQADVTTLTGYDSTQTQTLKNINGVLQWVTD